MGCKGKGVLGGHEQGVELDTGLSGHCPHTPVPAFSHSVLSRLSSHLKSQMKFRRGHGKTKHGFFQLHFSSLRLPGVCRELEMPDVL